MSEVVNHNPESEFDPSVIEKAERIRRLGHQEWLMDLVEPAVKFYWRHSTKLPIERLHKHPDVFVAPEDVEKIPSGPIVAAFKHNGYDDIPASKFLLAGRYPKFLGKVDLWDNWAVGAGYTMLGGEPIVRPTDSEELANWDTVVMPRLLEALENGTTVLGYPEGTRHPGPKVGKVKRGLTMLAYTAKVPLVPFGIANSHVKGPIAMSVGEPILPTSAEDFGGDDFKAMTAMHSQLRKAMQPLNNRAYELLANRTGQDLDVLMATSQQIGDQIMAERRLKGGE